MNNIIVLGNLSYNINLFFNSYPIENHEFSIVKKYKSIGNNVNIPIILSKYNLNVYYFSNIGNDFEGNIIIDYLKNNNIDTNYINIIKNVKTNQRYIIRNIKNDSKTILSNKINAKYIIHKNITFRPDVIYADIYDINILMYLKNSFNNIKIITHFNEISTNAINLGKNSDYVIITLNYAELLTNKKLNINNKKSIIDIYINVKKIISSKIIMYIESLGVVYENNNSINIISKLGDKSRISDNGLDIFIATFIYSVNKCFTIDKCLKLATISKFLSDNNKQNLNIDEVIKIYEKNN